MNTHTANVAEFMTTIEPTPRSNENLSRVFDDDLEKSIIELKQKMDADHARLRLRIAEFDRRGIASDRYELTTKQWLAYRCRMTPREASGVVKSSRALAAMPAVAEGALAGTVTHDGLKLLTQAQGRHPEAFKHHEAVFADIATYLTSAELRKAISHWSQQVDFASAVAEARHITTLRQLAHHQTLEGMWALNGTLDPESGEVLDTALRSYTDPQNLDLEERRTLSQRRHDALVDICRFWLDHNTSSAPSPAATSGGEKPHITVTVDYTTLAGRSGRLPEIDGVPIAPETLERLLCDAGIVRIVTAGDSQPLDVGRRIRTVTPAIRRALDTRDGGCVWEGCGAPVSWCDGHHIVPWAEGGRTSLSNMVLLCRRHHRATHEPNVVLGARRTLEGPGNRHFNSGRPLASHPLARGHPT